MELGSGSSSFAKFGICGVLFGDEKLTRVNDCVLFFICLFVTELPKDVPVDLDSDHDYETVDETLVNVVRKAQENILYY